MRKSVIVAALVGLAAALSGPTAAQNQNTAQSGSTPSAEIEVRGERRLDDQQLADSLGALARPSDASKNNIVPRFFGAICPRVIGIERKTASSIEARISAVADYLELPRPTQKCKPNAIILILEQPSEMFEKVIKKRPSLLGGSEVRDIRLDLIRADLRAGAPLVAWNQILTEAYDGATTRDGTPFPATGGLVFGQGVVVTPTTIASRLRSSIYEAKDVAVVVFDKKQLANVSALQLADLASLYLFGLPPRQGGLEGVAAPSLLNLFREGAENAPVEMTDFDRAYLKGIYSLRPNDRSYQLYSSVAAAYDKQCAEEGAPCPADPAPKRN